MKISFHGGAREVTGACHLLETASTKLLIDCGLFQGSSECEDLNFEAFKFDPPAVGVLIVTHGHLDHVGRIPKLIREGFRGPIYSTAASKDLARLILEDALSLARREDRELYAAADLEQTFRQWKTIGYRMPVEVKGVRFQLRNAGHILGSALIELWAEGKHLLFSGDLGNVPSELISDPDIPNGIEYLVVEATYGNRVHEPAAERRILLERAVEDTAARHGALMIPAFAAERTQEILFLLNDMVHHRRIPDIPVFVDSPLAIRITEVFERHIEEYKDEIKTLWQAHPNLFKFKRLKMTPSVEESKAINAVPAPKVIIAGSGMMTGGRILHHARRYLSDEKSILLVIGYQASGSLGRRLLDGDKLVKILGEEVSVRAEIRKINGFSAHADNPQLFAFVEANRDTLKHVFVVQGEEPQALHFAQEIKDRLGIPADVPVLHQGFEI